MAHSNITRLTDYWQARHARSLAPARASIDPMDFVGLLPQVVMLGRKAPGEYLFRLAGGFVTDLHGRDLRGRDFSTLWSQRARLPIKTAFELARRKGEPVRLTCDVQAGLQTLPLEMIFLPLTNADGEIDRYMGLYQPTAPVARLRGATADRLELVSLQEQVAEEAEQPRIRLVAVAGQRVR